MSARARTNACACKRRDAHAVDGLTTVTLARSSMTRLDVAFALILSLSSSSTCIELSSQRSPTVEDSLRRRAGHRAALWTDRQAKLSCSFVPRLTVAVFRCAYGMRWDAARRDDTAERCGESPMHAAV